MASLLSGIARRLRGERPVAAAPDLAIPSPAAPLTVELVRERDVLAGYPDAATRAYTVARWEDGPPGATRTLGVYEVAGAYVTRGYVPIDPARGHAIIDHTYGIMSEVSAAARDGTHFDFAPETVEQLDGRVAVMGGPFESNYFHALLNWFPRYALLETIAPDIYRDPSVPLLVDHRVRDEPFRSMLEALGVDFGRVLWADQFRDYRIERAVLTSFVRDEEFAPEVYAAMAAKMRAVLGIPRRERGSRRIWVSREHLVGPPRRRVVNIDEIAATLDAHGFERIALEELSFADQVRLFSDAELIAGSHGAGFANLIFAPPACRLLTLEKGFTRLTTISRLFVNLARIMGMEAEVMPVDDVGPADRSAWQFIDFHHADARVDPALFATTLARFAERRA